MFIDGLLNMLINMNFVTGYLSNSNSFPKPLDEKEERYYITKLKEGDIHAKSILVEKNLRLVAHIVKKYTSTGKDNDELISIGTVGLIKAIDSFQPNKGTRLATYAARCIENEILMLIRNNKKTKGEVFLQEPIGVDKEGNEIHLSDVIEDPSTPISIRLENEETIREIKESLKQLSDREYTIIKYRYGLDNTLPMTQRELAKYLNISRSYVSRIEKRAISKILREFIKKNKD